MIAVEHPRVGQEVVCKPDRLRPLKVGVSRHQRVEMLGGAGDECLGERLQGCGLRRSVLPNP